MRCDERRNTRRLLLSWAGSGRQADEWRSIKMQWRQIWSCFSILLCASHLIRIVLDCKSYTCDKLYARGLIDNYLFIKYHVNSIEETRYHLPWWRFSRNLFKVFLNVGNEVKLIIFCYNFVFCEAFIDCDVTSWMRYWGRLGGVTCPATYSVFSQTRGMQYLQLQYGLYRVIELACKRLVIQNRFFFFHW